MGLDGCRAIFLVMMCMAVVVSVDSVESVVEQLYSTSPNYVFEVV